MTALNETEQLLLQLERLHADREHSLEERLKTSSELIDSLYTLKGEMQQKLTLQENKLITQWRIMAEQNKQIQRIKPTLFGAYIGGLVSGAILATVIGAYILWVQG